MSRACCGRRCVTRCWLRSRPGHWRINGDLASLILFGGILAWAVLDLIMINRMQPEWQRPEPGPWRNDLIGVVVAVVVMGAIGWVHGWLGYPVFGA